MGTVLTYGLFAALLALSIFRHVQRTRKKEAAALAAAERGKLHSGGPRAQHPHIDVSNCIGCGGCATVCPEGDVLAVIAGKAAIVNGHKCIGHGLCADACPVGAIEIVMASPGISADTPTLTDEYETNIPNMFVVGELGGLALIKNAINQGRDCVDIIAGRLASLPRANGILDLCVVGAGPGGISASLRAVENRLSFVTIEQEEFGGTVAKYPRQKLVMTSPVELPMYGKFNKLEISKERLLDLWRKIGERTDLPVHCHEKVDGIARGEDGVFTVQTTKGEYRSRCVILAIGRRGTPRKLGVPGEELPKVMYSLLEAEAYTNAGILVVGGGDSAVEAAMGLAYQEGNRVVLSYRREEFTRLKERNAQRIHECMRAKKVEVVFRSQVAAIDPESVVLDLGSGKRQVANDYVWVFAGGVPPTSFLQKIGVTVGAKDLTAEAGAEACLRGLRA